MVKSVRFLLLLIAFVSMQIVAWGQPQERLVQVQVTPDHTNWLYKPGEKVKFKVTVLKCNIPQDNLEAKGVSMKAWLPSAFLLKNCNRPLRCPSTFWNFGKVPKKPLKSGHWNR